MSIKIVVLKTNGLQTGYQQSTASIAREVVGKLVPRNLFSRGPLVLGTGNPYTLINPQHIACIEIETGLQLQTFLPPGIKTATQINDRAAFLQKLERRWSTWKKLPVNKPNTPFEALLHLELSGGWEQHVHITGQFPDRSTERKIIENLFGLPVLCVHRSGAGMNYVNPSSIVRMRIYHSNRDPFRPAQLIQVDPQDI